MDTFETRISRAQESFIALITAQDIYTKRQLLTMASELKDHIIEDPFITNHCSDNPESARIRKGLLDEIKHFQNVIIKDTCNHETGAIFTEGVEIKDYDKAKSGLLDLVKEDIYDSAALLDDHRDMCTKEIDIPAHIELDKSVIYDCEEDRYSILIMGDYQSGKTTTLNALCGGIPIGAMGKGSSTSAVPLELSYGDDFEIVWKSDEELLKDVFNCLPAGSLSSWKDLKQQSVRSDIFRKIIAQKDGLSDGTQKKQLISAFILSMYDSPNLASVRSAKYSWRDISWLTSFPSNRMTRWSQEQLDGFSERERYFVLIKTVKCAFPSENLKFLNGGIIIDSPGLFASDYDTSVTEEAMEKANAILYILPRQTETGERHIENLNRLKDKYKDYHRKLIVALNQQTTDPNAENIREQDESFIHDMFEGKVRFEYYDALLAYLGQIRCTYDLGGIPLDVVDDFINKANTLKKEKYSKRPIIRPFEPIKSFEQAWRYHIRPFELELQEFEGESYSMNAEQAISESRLNKLLETVYSFIVDNKAREIIVGGVNKVEKDIGNLCSPINTMIVSHSGEYGKTAESWDNRIKTAQDLQPIIREMVRRRFFQEIDGKESICDEFSADIYAKLFSETEYKDMAKSMVDVLIDNAKDIRKLQKAQKKNKDSTELQEFLERQFSDTLTKRVSSCIERWNKMIDSGQDEQFCKKFKLIIDALQLEVDAKWAEVFHDDEQLRGKALYYCSIPQSIKGNVEGVGLGYSGTLGYDRASAIYDIAKITGTIVLGGAALTSYIAFCFATGIVGAAIGLILALGLGISALFFPDKVEEFKRKRVHKENDQKFRDAFKEGEPSIESSLKEKIKNMVSKLLMEYVNQVGIDFHRFNNAKDLALASVDNEEKCFEAVEILEHLHAQLDRCTDFKRDLGANGQD